MALVHNLELTEKQVNFLNNYGIDASVPGSIHIVEGKDLHPNLSETNAYFGNQYIFFLEGDSAKHSICLKTILKTNQAPMLKGLYAGVSIYATWLEQYKNKDGEVLVVNTPTPSEVNYTM
jgi:hypothetical protein